MTDESDPDLERDGDPEIVLEREITIKERVTITDRGADAVQKEEVVQEAGPGGPSTAWEAGSGGHGIPPGEDATEAASGRAGPPSDEEAGGA